MPNNSSARRDKKEKKKKKVPKPLSKQGRSASSDSSSSFLFLSSSGRSYKHEDDRLKQIQHGLLSLLFSNSNRQSGKEPPFKQGNAFLCLFSLVFVLCSRTKRSKPSEEGDEEDSASEDDHQNKSQVKPPTSSQEHFAKLLTRSKSKEDLKEGPLQGQPGDKDSPSVLPIPKQARNIVEVRTERDSAVEAIAWRVDPTVTGALERQPSSADTQQGSSSVISSVSSDSSNMPPGFISLAANRVNAADLIRGRGALRTLPAYAQTAGTAVSLLPSQSASQQAVI
jgi:hypothetical protein